MLMTHLDQVTDIYLKYNFIYFFPGCLFSLPGHCL